MQKKNGEFYFLTSKNDYARVEGNLAMLSWLSILKDYAKRMRADRYGFVRIRSDTFENDWGLDRVTVWRYNRKLEDIGLIELDHIKRGGRTWVGFRLV